MKKIITMLTLCLCSVHYAYAAPMHYTINFDAGSGGITPSASFDYDGSLAVNQQFSNFSVLYNFLTFDFTNTANNFSFLTAGGAISTSCAGTTGVNDAFELLTHAACVDAVATSYQWFGGNISGVAEFSFAASGSDAVSQKLFVDIQTTTLLVFQDRGTQYLATTQETTGVPEPGTIALLSLGIAGLGWSRRKHQQA